MSISTIYRAEVKIPEHLYDRFGHTREYDLRSSQIYNNSGVAHGGQDAYSQVYEWAEDSDRKCVERFERDWLAFIKELEARA